MSLWIDWYEQGHLYVPHKHYVVYQTKKEQSMATLLGDNQMNSEPWMIQNIYVRGYCAPFKLNIYTIIQGCCTVELLPTRLTCSTHLLL